MDSHIANAEVPESQDMLNEASSHPYIWHRVSATWLSRKPSVNAGIISALATFILIIGSVIYQQNFFHAQEWMAASPQRVFQHKEYWRLWTTLFAHADVHHLLSNTLFFFILGYFINGYFGLALFPFAAFAFGGITNIFVLMNMPEDVKLIGASGVVYWLAGLWLTLYFAIDKRRTISARALRSIGVALGVFMPTTTFDPSVSYSAHLIGFIIGALYAGLYYWRHRRKFNAALEYQVFVD